MEAIKRWMGKYGYWFCSLALFLALFGGVAAYRGLREKPCRIVCLGDSILGNVRDETSVTAVMERVLDETVYNGAFGGTAAARWVRENRPTRLDDALSLVRLSQAIVNEDFGVQNASVTGYAAMDYFMEGVYGFQRIDFDKVEMLVIEHGVNDYQLGIALENPEDPYDPYTYGGALRTSLRGLRDRYPDMEILLVTPTYCWYPAENLSCEEADFGGGLLEEYVALELSIAEKMGVTVLDDYHESGVGAPGGNEDWQTYTVDGIHGQ